MVEASSQMYFIVVLGVYPRAFATTSNEGSCEMRRLYISENEGPATRDFSSLMLNVDRN